MKKTRQWAIKYFYQVYGKKEPTENASEKEKRIYEIGIAQLIKNTLTPISAQKVSEAWRKVHPKVINKSVGCVKK